MYIKKNSWYGLSIKWRQADILLNYSDGKIRFCLGVKGSQPEQWI